MTQSWIVRIFNMTQPNEQTTKHMGNSTRYPDDDCPTKSPLLKFKRCARVLDPLVLVDNENH